MLNFHHLHYFWTVAHEGTVLRAAERLGVSQPTVSTQLQALEQSLGVRLFQRRGRTLALTESGRLTLSYADEIFARGRELREALQEGTAQTRFAVGVSDSLAKLVVYQLLSPLFEATTPIQLVCREATLDILLSELAVHRIDMVLTDAPIGTDRPLRAYNHFLGECSLEVFGATNLLRGLPRACFPKNLDGQPFLLPLQHSVMRRALDAWFEGEGIYVDVRGEFEDSATMKAFGQAGVGFFVAPSLIRQEVIRQYNVCSLGEIESVQERFYAISVERRIKHPAVAMIANAAKERLLKK